MRPYGKQYDPSTNAKGVDTSPGYNKAPKGAQVRAKKRLRRIERKSTRQHASMQLRAL